MNAWMWVYVAYALGLGLMLGYGVMLWIAARRNRGHDPAAGRAGSANSSQVHSDHA